MNILSLLWNDPWAFLVFVVAFLLVLSVHEASHAFAATLLGDQTAKRMDRLTLNPFAHVDLSGFIMLLVAGFGWGKPVPFNPYNLKYRVWGPALVAAAGPASNLVFGIMTAVLFRLSAEALGPYNLLVQCFATMAFLNFGLMLFNLIPIPPLDGSKALLAALADDRHRNARLFLETQGPLLLIGLVLVDTFLPIRVFGFLGRAADWLFQTFSGVGL